MLAAVRPLACKEVSVGQSDGLACRSGWPVVTVVDRRMPRLMARQWHERPLAKPHLLRDPAGMPTTRVLTRDVEVQLELLVMVAEPAIMSLGWDFSARWFASFGGADRRLAEQGRNRGRHCIELHGLDHLLGVNELHGGRCRPLAQVVGLRRSHEVGAGRQGCCIFLLYSR